MKENPKNVLQPKVIRLSRTIHSPIPSLILTGPTTAIEISTFGGLWFQGATPGETRICNALEYHIYCLANESSKYDAYVAKSITKLAKPLALQIKTNILHSLDLISIINLQSTFKSACDIIGILEGAAMLFLCFFMNNLAVASLNPLRALSSN